MSSIDYQRPSLLSLTLTVPKVTRASQRDISFISLISLSSLLF